VREQLRRIQGVGDARLSGAREHSMRIWLNPEKLSSLSMIPSDVVAALREQNTRARDADLSTSRLERIGDCERNTRHHG